MKACSNPCKECPFTKQSLKGWLASYKSPQELHNIIMMAELPFPCHMTHKEELEWSQVGSEQNPLCKGALLYMKKNAKYHSNKMIRDILKSITQDEVKDTFTVPEFFSHHTLIFK